jgi:hypothetical protein
MSVLTWTTPTTISGFTASDPKVMIDSSGNSTAVWVEQSTYSTGTCSQSGTTVTGTGTTFTSSMVGGTIAYSSGVVSNITAFVSTTSLTTSQSLTISNQAYTIYYDGVNYQPLVIMLQIPDWELILVELFHLFGLKILLLIMPLITVLGLQ